MKKLLSLVLVFAMVLSCISMVSIFAGDVNVGVKLTAKNNVTGEATAFTNVNAGFTTADVVNGYITRDYTIYNPNSYDVTVCIQYRNGWNNLILKGDLKTATVKAQSKEAYRLAIPVTAEGNVVVGETNVPLADVVLRVDVKSAMTEGDSIYVECAADDAAHSLTSSYFTISSVTEIPAIPAASAAPVVFNGDAENGTTNWGVWNGGSIANVADPDDANNNVIKFTPTGQYHSVAINLGREIIDDPDNGYNGGGAGKYTITFRAKAAEGKTSVFGTILNSQNHVEPSTVAPYTGLSERTYISKGGITMTDQWQQFSFEVEVTEAWLDAIKAMYRSGHPSAKKTYDLTIRLDGSGSSRTFSTELFEYYIDDVTIEREADPVGIQIDITEDIVGGHPYWRKGSAGYTEAMAVDNVITVAYDVYNLSNHEISFILQPQIGWDPLAGASTKKAIPAQSKETVSVKIKTDGNGNAVNATGDVLCALSEISFRFDLETGSNMTAGTSFIVACDDVNDVLYSVGNMSLNGSTAGAATKTVVTELPNLTVATPTPVADKAVVNGDAELGVATGWSTFFGGVTKVMQDDQDATKHVIYFTPAGKYTSVAFDLSPAIIQDAAKGYKGEGAGTYQISFRTKAEEGKGGDFAVTINSQWHNGAGTVVGDYTTTVETWAPGTTIAMTDQWQSVTATVKVTEEFLENIYAVYAAGATRAYDLILRLDGSGDGVAFAESQFKYFIDDVTIMKVADPTPTPATTEAPVTDAPVTTAPATTDAPVTTAPVVTTTPVVTPAPVGLKVTTNAENTGWYYVKTGTGVLAADTSFTGTKELTYTIYNTSNVDVNVDLSMQVTHKKADGKDTWAGVAGSVSKLVEAGAKADVTFSFPVENGLVTVTNGGATAQYALDKLFVRIDYKFVDSTAVGNSIVIAANSETDKILGSVSASQATKELVYELPAYNYVTPTPVADKVVTNGDAENGNVGWDKFFGGTTTIVADPDNANNHVAYFVATGKYHSIAFDLGPAVVQDAANGYKGEGAGTYTITFKAKADAGKGGIFTVTLNSTEHLSKGSSVGTYTTTIDTWAPGTNVEITDEWATYTATVKVTEEFLDNIYEIYKAGKTNVYKLILRLDGANYAFKDSEFFGYYIDDVTIAKQAAATPTPTATAAPGTTAPAATATPVPTPAGPKFENGNVENGMTNWGTIHGGKVELVQPGANGTGNAIKFTASGKYHSVAFDLGPAIVKDEAAGYNGAGATKYTLTFYAKGEEEGKFSIFLNSYLHLSDANIKEIDPALSCGKDTYLGVGSIQLTTEWQKYTLEFTVEQDWLDTLKGLKASSHANASKAYQIALRLDGSTGAYNSGEFFGYMIDEVTLTAANADGGSTETKVPTGVTIQAKDDVEAATWFKTQNGVVSAADIKNGEITKTFKITNNGDETIRVCLTLQATVKVDGKDTWKGQNNGEYIEIEPGKTETLTFTMEVNDDKTVTVGDTDVALKDFFARFDVKGEDGNALPKGTKFTIHGTGDVYTLLSKLSSSDSTIWSAETSYATSGTVGSGDALPVALIATVLVATTALVVVAKKRKED